MKLSQRAGLRPSTDHREQLGEALKSPKQSATKREECQSYPSALSIKYVGINTIVPLLIIYTFTEILKFRDLVITHRIQT